MTKKTAKPAKPAKPAAKTYILFGTDEYAKPRAARFSTADPEPLAKASESLHLRMVEVAGHLVRDLHRRRDIDLVDVDLQEWNVIDPGLVFDLDGVVAKADDQVG